MSAPYIIPFNFQPVSTVVGTSGSYTVPSGKYAKVTINLGSRISTGLVIGGGQSITSVSYYDTSSTDSSVSQDIFLKAGDVLTFANSSAASGPSQITAGGLFMKVENSVANQQALVNSVVVAEAKATMTAYMSASFSGSGASVTLTCTSYNVSGYIVSEYNVIS